MSGRDLDPLRFFERRPRSQGKATPRGLGQRDFLCKIREIRAKATQQLVIRQAAE
jgi:hypothetical protein